MSVFSVVAVIIISLFSMFNTSMHVCLYLLCCVNLCYVVSAIWVMLLLLLLL